MKRSELESGDSSTEASPRSGHVENLIPFEFIEHALPETEQHVEDEDEMDFCLFAPTPGKPKDTQPVSRIRLKSPTPSNAEPGLENPHRDQGYYFTKPLSPEQLESFQSTAVSGQDIKTRSCSLCPATSYPWKLTHIKATKSQALLLQKACAVYDVQEPTKRKRPGKQARIKSRTRLAMTKAAEVENQKAAAVKELADREKRTRRNREKKAKKKIREKAKKASSAGNAGAAVESEGEDDKSDDDSSQPG